MSTHAFLWAASVDTPCAESRFVLLMLADLAECEGPGVFMTPAQSVEDLTELTMQGEPFLEKALRHLLQAELIQPIAVSDEKVRFRMLLNSDPEGTQA